MRAGSQMVKLINIIKRYKEKVLLLILAALFIFTFFYTIPQQYSKIISSYQDSLKTHQKDLSIKKFMEGSNINEFVLEGGADFFEKANYSNSFCLLILLKNISCYSCIKYHLEHIKKLGEMWLPVFAISEDKFQLIKSYVPNAKELAIKKDLITIPFHYELLVLLIDRNGKIIKLDSADKNNYYKSDVFYTTVERLMQN